MTTTVTKRVLQPAAGGENKRVNSVSLLLLEGDQSGFLLLDMGSDGLLLEGDMTALGGTITKRVPDVT